MSDLTDLQAQNARLRQALRDAAAHLYHLAGVAELSGEPVLAEFARRWAGEAEAAAKDEVGG